MKKIKNIVLLSFIMITTIGCDTDLDLFPADSIEQSQSFKTIADAENWDNGLFATFRSRVYGNNTITTDIQADQLNASIDYGNRNGAIHRWSDFYSNDQTLASIWRSYYFALRNVNVAIAGYSNITVNSPSEASDLEVIKGNAYLLRAFYYHRLVLRFAKAYDLTTASTDLGVPLVLEYDVNGRPSRSTVEQVYTQILADITEAKNRLNNITGYSGATKFTYDAVLALEARVKFYKQDWPGAKTAADILINSARYPLLTTQIGLNDMWVNDNPQEVIMQSFTSIPNELPTTNNVYLGYNPGLNQFTPDFIPSQWVLDMYDNNDFRKNTFFDDKSISIQGTTYNNVTLVNKYPGNPALFTSANTNYAHSPKVFRIAEMYLISAEAAAKSTGDATTPLNALRNARGLSNVSSSGPALLQDIKDERFRELAFEGFRLDDLKRYNEGFTRNSPQNTAFIQIGSDFDTKTVTAGADKFVWGIPNNDMISNDNLKGQQNNGW